MNAKRKREAQLGELVKGGGRPPKLRKLQSEAELIIQFLRRRIDSYYASEKEFSVKTLLVEAAKKGFCKEYIRENKKALRKFIKGYYNSL